MIHLICLDISEAPKVQIEHINNEKGLGGLSKTHVLIESPHIWRMR